MPEFVLLNQRGHSVGPPLTVLAVSGWVYVSSTGTRKNHTSSVSPISIHINATSKDGSNTLPMLNTIDMVAMARSSVLDAPDVASTCTDHIACIGDRFCTRLRRGRDT